MKNTLFAVVILSVVFQSCHSGETNTTSSANSSNALSSDSIKAIARNAYVYGMAAYLMDVTRKKITNVEAPVLGLAAPINQIFISTSFLPPDQTQVVRPNADTYYTAGFLDLVKEPMVLTVPVTNDSYYLLPMLDGFGNVFASPGKRTGITKGGTFLLTGPGWKDSSYGNQGELG